MLNIILKICVTNFIMTYKIETIIEKQSSYFCDYTKPTLTH